MIEKKIPNEKRNLLLVVNANSRDEKILFNIDSHEHSRKCLSTNTAHINGMKLCQTSFLNWRLETPPVRLMIMESSGRDFGHPSRFYQEDILLLLLLFISPRIIFYYYCINHYIIILIAILNKIVVV